MTRAADAVVPTVMLAKLIEPPKPQEVTPPLSPQPPPQVALPKRARPMQGPPLQPAQKAVSTATRAPATAIPLPAATADPTPAANAPTGPNALQPVPASSAAPLAAASIPSPAAVTVQLPSSDADHLNNPLPQYPPISRRLNEHGTSTVRVLIGADGIPQRAELVKSSGFERLDKLALATAMRWRYVPGKRAGVAEAMSVNVPIVWALN